MSDCRRDPRFVVSRERTHAIAEPLRDEGRVLRETIGRVSVGPPVVVTLQRCRQVPMVESREGFNAALEEPVNQSIVEIDARSEDRAGSRRLNSRPGNGEAIRTHAEASD